jgi:hypothetical protein
MTGKSVISKPVVSKSVTSESVISKSVIRKSFISIFTPALRYESRAPNPPPICPLPPEEGKARDFTWPLSQVSWGNIKVRVYDAPDGSRPVFGKLEPQTGTVMGVLRGQMNGARLEGQFLEVNGTLTGEMSPDGKTMSGTFSFANVLGPPGTWTAQKN